MIAIALGANLDGPDGSPPYKTLDLACRALIERGVLFNAVSRIWESAPVPYDEAQPWFYNAVAAVETDLPPLELLAELHTVEEVFGRQRREVNAPRTLDMGLLFYNEQRVEEGATIPHPRMKQRAFVLYPLRDIKPEWRDNETDLDISALIRALDDAQEIRPSSHHFTFMKEAAHDA